MNSVKSTSVVYDSSASAHDVSMFIIKGKDEVINVQNETIALLREQIKQLNNVIEAHDNEQLEQMKWVKIILYTLH